MLWREVGSAGSTQAPGTASQLQWAGVTETGTSPELVLKRLTTSRFGCSVGATLRSRSALLRTHPCDKPGPFLLVISQALICIC